MFGKIKVLTGSKIHHSKNVSNTNSNPKLAATRNESLSKRIQVQIAQQRANASVKELVSAAAENNRKK